MPRPEKVYVVQPPDGRFHESLWEIAQNHLGDGRRYREIFELNSGRPQPDGSRLTIASLIRPGWVLRMPPDASGPGIEVISLAPGTDMPAGQQPPGQPGHAGTSPPSPGEGTGAANGRASGSTGRPSGHAGGTAGHAGGTAGHAGGHSAGHAGGEDAGHASGHSASTAGHPAGQGQAGQGPPDFPAELAAASLLAAGILAALGRRRRVQLWRRAFGKRLVRPAGEAAQAEVALRAGASEPAVQLLDTGLRYLARALAAQGRPLPTAFAAHSGAENLDLWIAPAGLGAPSPWLAVGDGQVWRLAAADVTRLDPDLVTGTPAPFPGLVSIGTDGAGDVLVDLGSARGPIAVTGPERLVVAVLAAVAAELATSRWSDRMRLTLVGFGADLAALAPDRVTSVRTLAEVLPFLEAQAAETIPAARTVSAWGDDRGTPHYLLMAASPGVAEAERLAALTRSPAAVAGYLVAGDVPGASWTWEVTEEGRLRAWPLGFDVEARLLPPARQSAVRRLFDAADAAAADGGTRLVAPAADLVPPAHLVPGSVMPVEITLLGPVAVQAPGPIEPSRLALATELAVFLAVHPGGVHPNVLTSAIWPRGVTGEVRDAVLARTRDWLGADDIGRPHLSTDAGGRLRLGSQVRVDWQVFQALVARAARDPADGPAEAALLERALSLVTGQLLDGHEPGRYCWLADDDLEYEVTARVADAAHRLAGLRLAAQDLCGAMDAARRGLCLAADDQVLWRDLLRAAHATGRDDLLRTVVDEARSRALAGALPRMAPETEALIDELLPSWRSPVG